jgi:import inner membrane translocase subunit TIM8
MDDLNVSAETAEGLKNLSVKDRQELQHFVQQEGQKAQIQSCMSIAMCLGCTYID